MPRTCRCPTCKTPTKVPADAAPGAAVTCPSCDEQFVPEQLAAGADDAPRERDDGQNPRKKRRRRRATPGRPEVPVHVTLVWAGLGVVALFFVVGLLLTALRIQVPTAVLSCFALVAIPLFVIAWMGRLLEHR